MKEITPAIWFPTIQANTGTDIFTERLAASLEELGMRTEITWLPHRSEYAPWTVKIPRAPAWANLAHVNTCMHSRFIPDDIPVIATIHHAVHAPLTKKYKSASQKIYHRHWIAPNERKVLRRADRAIAVSNHVAATCQSSLLSVPIQTIYNGVDLNIFKPKPRKNRDGAPFQLLYVGSWIKRKGVDMLPRIMRELGKGFELYYTGPGVTTSNEAKNPSNMHDIGRLHGAEQVAAALRDADALLFPSRSEGFGLIAAEASACGIPVIATDSSSLTEVIQNGVTGILCPPDDVQAFARAARWLAGNPNEYDLMSTAGLTRAKNFFSQERMIADYVKVYRSAISIKPS